MFARKSLDSVTAHDKAMCRFEIESIGGEWGEELEDSWDGPIAGIGSVDY